MKVIGYKAIVPNEVIELMHKVVKNPYAAEDKFLGESPDMSNIILEPIVESTKAIQKTDFFNPATPIGFNKTVESQNINYLF